MQKPLVHFNGTSKNTLAEGYHAAATAITAALDKDTERDVCATLRALAGKITIIAVSHQAEMVRVADRVIRLERGVLSTA